MHIVQKKDISISGEEIFLPTDINELDGEKKKEEPQTSLDYEVLPTKPEDID